MYDLTQVFQPLGINVLNFTLAGFGDDLSKTSIPTGSSATAIDLKNGTLISQINQIPLIN